MLYPKNATPSLDPKLFADPSAEYRGAPFWAWNTRLEEELLFFEIDCMKEMGLGGFHLHSRSGLETPYLSDEFLRLIKACVARGRDRGMLSWLYDEDRWPSGAAGGLVTKDHAYRMRYLLFTPFPYGDPRASRVRGTAFEARLARNEGGRLLARYAVELEGGRLSGYRILNPTETLPPGSREWFAYLETAGDQPWYNNQAYLDTLSKRAVERFIATTHERYLSEVGTEFGKAIPAIFTDEPQFARKQSLGFADEERDLIIPYTEDFDESYRAAYGEDLLSRLPELFWEGSSEEPSLARYRYHDHVAERFASAFADTIGSWCSAHGLMLTGHMMEEPTLESQTAALGEAMRSYRSFQLPGIDMLCDRRELTTAKQAQSAAHQLGAPGVLSELYGVTGWHFDFRGHKLQGDWQAALGVSVRVHHLTWVSMEGEAKRDYPASIGYQSPWYREYPMVENHFARVNTALTRGEPRVRIAVVHPVESYWLAWGPREQTALLRDELEQNFENVTNWLLFGQLDFDYLAESLLEGRSEIVDGRLVMGTMSYDAVVVPGCRTLRSQTLSLLEEFRRDGGTLIFVGQPPSLLDARRSEEPARLAEESTLIPFSRSSLLASLEPFREVEVRGPDGSLHDNLIYQLRTDRTRRWLFLSHVRPPENPDLPLLETITLRLRGSWRPTLYDTADGTTRELAATISRAPAGAANAHASSSREEPWTELAFELAAYDSLLFALDPADSPRGAGSTRPTGTSAGAPADKAADAPAPRPPVSHSAEGELLGHATELGLMEGPVPVDLSEPNVLLLDRAEYSLDGGAFRGPEELLRLDNELREELGWSLRGRRMAQPWVEPEDADLHRLSLRYRVRSEVEIERPHLPVEHGSEVEVTLNGQRVAAEPDGWFVDRSISTLALPKIVPGESELIITVPFGRRIGAEWCYILGDFGVAVHGAESYLTPPVRSLSFGDWTRQGLPFYAGNVTYRIELSGGGRRALQVPQFRNPLLSVRVDGREAGRIAYSPYVVDLGDLSAGRHTVELTAYGNRANAFGPVHNADETLEWLGPQSWRTAGASWSYEYQLRRTGVLTSPRLLELR